MPTDTGVALSAVKTRGRRISLQAISVTGGRKSSKILLAFFLRDALSFLSRLREPDRNGLLSAFDFTAFPTPATFGSASFIAPHLAFYVAARAGGIFALLFLCH
jgi:hypothetical protein